MYGREHKAGLKDRKFWFILGDLEGHIWAEIWLIGTQWVWRDLGEKSLRQKHTQVLESEKDQGSRKKAEDKVKIINGSK